MKLKLDIGLDNLLLAFNIVNGNLYPVNKLINKNELYNILNAYEFNGSAYSLPYLFFIDHPIVADHVECFYMGNKAFVIEVESCFTIDKADVAIKMFGTSNPDHPGVSTLLSAGGYVISGYVKDFDFSLINIPYTQLDCTPAVVFQSRNPPHKAHEIILAKHAPNILYTTPFSTTKSTDYPFSKKLLTYEKLKEIYGVSLYVSTLPRVFAGPREALQNCLIFQNLGAKQFLMGRGKNCVGNFYRDDEPFKLCIDFYLQQKILIEPVWHDTIYSEQIELKATNIKVEYIDKEITPPEELMSGYISSILLNND